MFSLITHEITQTASVHERQLAKLKPILTFLYLPATLLQLLHILASFDVRILLNISLVRNFVRNHRVLTVKFRDNNKRNMNPSIPIYSGLLYDALLSSKEVKQWGQ